MMKNFDTNGADSMAQNKPKIDETNIEIPYEKFKLDNGLTLIVHEDHKVPIVSVDIWYHVGSKNEKPGKTGFAHLFEHLMFNGSENFNDDYFQTMEKIGATDLNGTTSEDRTNYFQNVPTSALDIALWMESDRMGHLLGAIDQAKLDEQRGVVQNEKRQYENEPYGSAEELITKASYPPGHPYSWTVIGSMDDISAASVDDVKEWFKTYYGAVNAVIAIAGDINSKTALEKVKKYFGDIPAGPPVSRQKAWIAKRSGTHREEIEDRVPQARIIKEWNVPQWGSKDAVYLDLLSDILGSGKNSRLYKRLVYDDQIATSISAYANIREIAGQFVIEADAKPGVDLSVIEKAIDEELNRFLRDGATEKEMKRIKTQYFSRFIRGVERIGGFGGKSDILAQCEVFGGSPDFYNYIHDVIREADADNLLEAADNWLTDGEYVLSILPYPEYTAEVSDVDRKKIPEQGETPDVKFPALQRAELSNGLKIVLAERHSVPVVNFNLTLDAGYAADQFTLPGTANLAMAMLDEGTKNRTSLALNEELALLGGYLSAGSSLDISSVRLSALKANLDESLDIYADVILNPIFPESDFQRLKKQQLIGIQQEKVTPIQMALRVFPKYVFGKGHAYGNPLTGSGTEESVSKITREHLVEFYNEWFKANNATMIVVGDITLNEITPKLEKLFSGWKTGETKKKNIENVSLPDKNIIYLLDRPDSQQSIVIAGHVAPPTSNPDEIAIQTMNNILGGGFVSRLNLNIREDKHWSYGASSFLLGARGQRPFIAYTSVQSDKTKETMVEFVKELKAIISSKPVTEDEFNKNQQNQILELPGLWETAGAILGSVTQIVNYKLPDDYFAVYTQKIKEMKLSDVTDIAPKIIKPDSVTWIIVGDRAKIETGIRELNLGEVIPVDSDGNVIK
jgi:zinc protease